MITLRADLQAAIADAAAEILPNLRAQRIPTNVAIAIAATVVGQLVDDLPAEQRAPFLRAYAADLLAPRASMLDAAPAAAASAFWRSHGLRSMTANALAHAGICGFNELMTRDHDALSRIYSIGDKGVAEIQQMLLRRAAAEAANTPPLACYGDDALVMELLRRGYRIDRPNPDA